MNEVTQKKQLEILTNCSDAFPLISRFTIRTRPETFRTIVSGCMMLPSNDQVALFSTISP